MNCKKIIAGVLALMLTFGAAPFITGPDSAKLPPNPLYKPAKIW